MVSKARRKGYRTVATVKKVLRKKGYIVANLEKAGKFIKEKDLWGLWDLLAVKGKTHVFIQVKTNAKGQKWKEPHIEFGKKHGSKSVKYEIWNKKDYMGIEITKCKE
jgi:Holliday junction resolvase